MARRKISAGRSPYYSNFIGGASFTIGAEAGNVINVAIQLKDVNNTDLTARGVVKAWLSKDANGDVILPAHLMPAGGFAVGTDGTILPGAPFANGVAVKAGLIIDATTAAQFSTSATAYYTINGAQYTKTATVDLTFTAAHVINDDLFGVVLVQINAAGTISTKVPLTPQVYTTAALARAALPEPDAGNVALGFLLIAPTAGNFTANSTALTGITTYVDASEVGALYPPVFDLLSEADGDIDINFTETGVRGPFYLNLLLPDGTEVTSGAITFA